VCGLPTESRKNTLPLSGCRRTRRNALLISWRLVRRRHVPKEGELGEHANLVGDARDAWWGAYSPHPSQQSMYPPRATCAVLLQRQRPASRDQRRPPSGRHRRAGTSQRVPPGVTWHVRYRALDACFTPLEHSRHGLTYHLTAVGGCGEEQDGRQPAAQPGTYPTTIYHVAQNPCLSKQSRLRFGDGGRCVLGQCPGHVVGSIP
jgi:hypothetical protein